MPVLPDTPLNREPDLSHLVQSFITDSKDGYDRNHCLHPNLDASTHRIAVDGAVKTELRLSVDNLQDDFEQHSVVCALQCAGNRRHTMRTQIKEVNGVDWGDAAVMNCKWTGPRLADILEQAGISLDDGRVAFACYSTGCQEDTWYGSSIPLSRAVDKGMDVILALKMNDEELTIGHGYPVRVIIPAIAGARAVKWLDRITVQEEEYSESAQKYWPIVPPVQDMPINSVIGVPQSDSTVSRDAEGTLRVQGYALPGGADGPITKVEVSGDNGKSWQGARLIYSEGESKWSWKLWEAKVRTDPGTNRTILSGAVDAGGNTQPEQPRWNIRGVCYNGYGDATNLAVE